MTKATLSEIIRNAMTNPDSPTQAAGIPLDDSKYEVFGDVPLPVQHLHNACCNMGDEIEGLGGKADEARAKGDLETVRSLTKQMKALREQYETLSSLRWALFEEAFPAKRSDYASLSIMENWQMAGQIRSEDDGLPDDMPDELKAMLAGLMDGDGHVGVLVMSGGRRRH